MEKVIINNIIHMWINSNKKLLAKYQVVTSLVMLLSYTSNSQNKDWQSNYDYIGLNSEDYTAVGKNNLYGFVDKDGNEVIKPQYYSIMQGFTDGIAHVSKNKLEHLLIDKRNNIILEIFEPYPSPMREGLIRIKKNSRFGFIDKIGKEVIPCQYYSADIFSKGHAIVFNERNRAGLINHKNELIIPYKYQSIEILDKNAIFVTDENDEKYIVSANDEKLIPFEIQKVVKDYKADFLTITKDDQLLIYKTDGVLLVNDTFSSVGRYNEFGYIPVEKRNKWALIDLNGRYITGFNFDFISNRTYNNNLLVSKNDKSYFIGKNLQRVNNEDFDTPDGAYIFESLWESNHIKLRKNQKCGIVDTRDFKIVIPFEYEEINAFPTENKFIIKAKKNGFIGYIDKKNQIIIPFEYEDASYFACPEIAVIGERIVLKKNKKIGVLDYKANKIIIPFEYDEIDGFDENNIASFVKNDKYGLINIENQIIIENQDQKLSLYKEYFYKGRSGNGSFLVDSKNKNRSNLYFSFNETKFGYIVKNKEGLHGFMDKNLKEVINTKYKLITVVYEYIENKGIATNYLAAGNEQCLYTIFDENLREVFPSNIKSDGIMYGDLFRITMSTGEGYANKNGKIVIPCIYKRSRVYGNGFVVYKNGFYGVIDKSNKIVQPFIYNDLLEKDDVIKLVTTQVEV